MRLYREREDENELGEVSTASQVLAAVDIGRVYRTNGTAHPKSFNFNLLDARTHPIQVVARPQWAVAAKRSLDVIGATVGLIVSSPFLLIIAVLIKLTSRGPVLFVQPRWGLTGRQFGCFKFRTMVENAEQLKQDLLHLNDLSGPAFKLQNDPRLTTVGKFLRKTSFDELPQLWNVLRGEMSFVGPRPSPLDEAEQYAPHHYRRLIVKPGITGLWQVSGRNTISDFDHRVALDLKYIDSWSLMLDFKILLKTIPAVISARGAY